MTTTKYDSARATQLHQKRDSLLKSSREILAKAKTDSDRDLTASEDAAIKSAMAEIKAIEPEIQAQGKAMVSAVMSLGSSDNYDSEGRDRTSVFSEGDKAGLLQAVKSRTSYRADVNMKAALVSNTLLPSSGHLVQPGSHPNAAFSLASLFPQQAADGPVVRYYRMTAGVANIVAEGAVKPDSGVAISGVDLALTKLVALCQFSSEMEEDAPFLMNYLSAELGTAIISAENALIVSTWANTSGILTATGAAATVVDLVADAVAAQQSLSGQSPSAIVAHPNTISTIRKSKASTSGVYNIDPLGATPAYLHGVPLVSSPAVAAANVWVVTSSGCTIYRRGPVKAELGTSNDDFQRNMQTLIAEERVGVAVTRPSAIDKIVLT